MDNWFLSGTDRCYCSGRHWNRVISGPEKHNETLAFAYAGARISESVLFAINVIPTLTLLTLSQEFMKAGTPDASWYQTMGSLLITAGDWTFLIGFAIAFTISALILNFVLYKSRLVPRWLSIWGFAGALLLWVYYLLQIFNMEHDILFVPIAVQEMALALWLITKGFDTSYNN
ncbi:MAG: DUF4386 domain-containing protein [Methanolobus sp.]